MHTIIYVSEYVNHDINQDLSDITNTSKSKNIDLDITGLLFHHNGKFLQIIEGEKTSLEKLMSSIEKDSRHTNIQRIIDEKISSRGYAEWNMDSFNLSDDTNLDIAKLKRIKNAYKEMAYIDSEILIDFYKVMIKKEDI